MYAQATMTFPNFLIIGAAKSGTYTLSAHFAAHPEVFMSPVKEPHFFAFGGDSTVNGRPVHTWIQSLEEYHELFANRGGARIVGESSVSYLYWPGTAERIHEFNPDMKLIVSLRDPIDRAYSSFNYAKSYGLEPLSTLFDGLKAESKRIRNDESILLRYRDLGLYFDQLTRFWNVFPREQIKVILYDDLVRSADRTVRELYDFVGVDANIKLDPRLHANETRTPDDNNPLHRFVNGEHLARAILRKLLPDGARHHLRDQVRKLLFKPPPKLGVDERRQVQHLFDDDVRQLEQLLDRDLSLWSQ